MYAFETDGSRENQKHPPECAQLPQPIGSSAAQNRPQMLWRIIDVPGGAIGLVPFLVCHFGVMRHPVVEIVFVDIGVHPPPLLGLDLVIFGAWQGRQEKEFENIERQFALYDFDIPDDRFLGVAGEAQYVAGKRNDALFPPFLQHDSVVGDLVLALLGSDEIVRVDILQPDEDMLHPSLPGLFYEVRNLVAERVDLDGEADILEFLLAQFDDAIEKYFPVGIAREIVVGDQKPLYALRIVTPDAALDVAGRARAALAALHVYYGAERTLKWAASPHVHAGK